MTEFFELKILGEKLRIFSNAGGTSGSEQKIGELLRQELLDLACSVKTDSLGNLIGTKAGNTPRIMITAHMDEIGLMVQGIDGRGFIRFIKIGGWYDPVILAQRVVLHGAKGDIIGVIGSRPPHAMTDQEMKQGVDARSMFVDIGAQSREDVFKCGINIGTTITIEREFSYLGASEYLVTGKGLDNRVGVTEMIEIMKRLRDVDLEISAVGTCQEEVGCKGGRVSAFRVNPEIAIVLDTTAAGGNPGMEGAGNSIKIGEGPVIVIADRGGRGFLAPMHMIERLKRIAEENKIKYQLQVTSFGTTDASEIQLKQNGIMTVAIKNPARYIHSPVEVADLRDMENAIRLVVAFVKDIERNGL